MQHQPTSFGTPLVRTSPLVSEVAAPHDPADVLDALRRGSRALAPGLILLESCAGNGPSTRLSLVGLRALLRLRVAGEEARINALDPAALPLLESLHPRIGGQLTGGALHVVRTEPALALDDALDDDARLRSKSVLDLVRVLAGALADGPAPAKPPRLAAGVFGAFAYDLVDRFERLPPRRGACADADLDLVLVSDLLVVDHARGVAQVITRGLPWETRAAVDARHRDQLGLVRVAPAAPATGSERPTPPLAADPDFQATVARMREHVAAGDVFQVVPSRTRTLTSAADPLAVYRALRAANPAPYMFALGLDDGGLLGASPETCLRVEDGEVEIRPIAGTVARGKAANGVDIDVDIDDRLALSLLLDPKEQAEHTMLLDLARNDVARVSVPGTCRVVQQFGLERYAHVQHLVSRVRGRLRPDLDALHAYRAAANMGTVTGAPKLRAMELLRQSEPSPRGFYGGALGYVLQDGSMDTCIVIRALRWSTTAGAAGVYTARAGAGVVFDSTPEREWHETELKMRCTLGAVLAADGDLR